MNRKEDKRNLNTKLKLANAFKELSKEKQMNKISINDLIKYCHLNRNTFYYHFEDIYDLINWMFKEETSKIIGDFDTNNLENFLNDVFDYVEKNIRILNSAYNSFGREQLKKLLYPYFYNILDLLITNNIKKMNSNIDDDFKKFIIDFYSEGLANSIINYFQKTQNYSKEQTINYLLLLNSIIPKIILEKSTFNY